MSKIFILLILLYCNLSVQQIDKPITFNNCGPSVDIVGKFCLKETIKNNSNYVRDTIYDTGTFLYYVKDTKTYYLTKKNKISNKYNTDIFDFEGFNCNYKYDTILIYDSLYYYVFF